MGESRSDGMLLMGRATATVAPERERAAELEVEPAAEVEPVVDLEVEPDLARALPLVTDRLCQRYPAVPVSVVQRCVHDAVVRGRDARVRRFLPILIERWAAGSLTQRGEVTARDSAAAGVDLRGT